LLKKKKKQGPPSPQEKKDHLVQEKGEARQTRVDAPPSEGPNGLDLRKACAGGERRGREGGRGRLFTGGGGIVRGKKTNYYFGAYKR